MAPVVDWVCRFGSFIRYEHRVQAMLGNGHYVPLPINRTTINEVFGTKLNTRDEVAAFLASLAAPIANPANAAEHLYAHIGSTLTDLFFRPYTRKMWDFDLEDLDAAVVKRIPLRYDDEDRYFPNDTFQILPEHGYTKVFENILDHALIRVILDTPFHGTMRPGYAHCFNSMAIDEYFGEMFGPLPYRSIRFEHREEPASYARGTASVVNFTDERPNTRETDWSRLPHHGAGLARKTITLEQACDYRDNAMERYYPVKTSDGRNDAIYQRYRDHAAKNPAMTFIGRCGTYQYLDMHQVINQSLIGARAWITVRK
jgi:UDP-galactopyranose mutase